MDLIDTGTCFPKFGTPFLTRDPKTGRLVVAMHYPQGKTIWTLTMAVAFQRSPGVWMRDNKTTASGGRFPKRYDSEHAALLGMIKKSDQFNVYSLGQSALQNRDAA